MTERRTRRYLVLLPLRVHTADASYEQGDIFEHEFTEEEETTNLGSGLLELVPMRYKVVGGSVVHDTQPGEVFERQLTIGEERLLLEGGHIERLPDKPLPRVPKDDEDEETTANEAPAKRTAKASTKRTTAKPKE